MQGQQASAADLLMAQFLAWVEGGGHSYAEAMEAWRSSCPRLSIWEDAIGDGLIRIDGTGAPRMAEARVVLTQQGRARLGGAAGPGGHAPSGTTAPQRAAAALVAGPA
jgi:hypothetical protein